MYRTMKKTSLRSILALAALFAAAALRADDYSAYQPRLKAGDMAPDFTAIDPAGHPVKLADFKGKLLVLDFWATWCPDCRASMPHLESIHQSYAGQNVVVYGSCTSDTRAAYEKYVAANKDKYTFLTAHDPIGRDPKEASRLLYGVKAIPTQFLIGPDGRILSVIVGNDPGDTRIERALADAGVKVDPAVFAQGAHAPAS
jgi:peroxiredoxin